MKKHEHSTVFLGSKDSSNSIFLKLKVERANGRLTKILKNHSYYWFT